MGEMKLFAIRKLRASCQGYTGSRLGSTREDAVIEVHKNSVALVSLDQGIEPTDEDGLHFG